MIEKYKEIIYNNESNPDEIADSLLELLKASVEAADSDPPTTVHLLYHLAKLNNRLLNHPKSEGIFVAIK